MDRYDAVAVRFRLLAGTLLSRHTPAKCMRSVRTRTSGASPKSGNTWTTLLSQGFAVGLRSGAPQVGRVMLRLLQELGRFVRRIPASLLVSGKIIVWPEEDQQENQEAGRRTQERTDVLGSHDETFAFLGPRVALLVGGVD